VSGSSIELLPKCARTTKKDFGNRMRDFNHMAFAEDLTALSASVLIPLVAFMLMGVIVFVISVRF
jgi:hypothetical protein